MSHFLNDTLQPLLADNEQHTFASLPSFTLPLGCLLATGIFFLNRYIYSPYTDKYGNKLPKGPRGLPIFGILETPFS